MNFFLFSRKFVAAATIALATALAPVAPLYAQVPGSLEDEPDSIEDQIEQEVEDQVQEDVQEDVVDRTEEAIEDDLDELVLGPGDREVEEQIEEEIEDQIAGEVEDSAEEDIENNLEEAVEDQIAETVTEELEDDVEENVQSSIEDSVASQVEESVEDSVASQVEDSVAANVEESVETDVESSVEEDIAQQVDEGVQSQIEESVASGVEGAVEDQLADEVALAAEAYAVEAVDELLDNEVDAILEDLESDLEADEERIHSDQWLVMAEPQVFEELAEQGYLFDTVTDLPALGMRLAEVAGPSSFDITEVRRGVLDVVGKDRAEVDLNHIYTAGADMAVANSGVSPRVAAKLPQVVPSAANQAPAKIGMIDSEVDTSHPSLAAAHIESRSFVPEGVVMPRFHGTAIASIIVANSSEYQGLDPSAQVYAAAVFQKDEERGEIASTVSLIRAVDWLMSSDVDVINISLAGPPNRLLEAALKRAKERNMLVLAAAGNGGPVAGPMYPAAYDSVVAVTAVDQSRRVFRLANRGTYLDIAAPGVGLLHAKVGGGFVASSGTSFAVPFAATAAAALRRQGPEQDVMSQLYQTAEDLGPPGRDDIYGYGLLRFQGS